MLRVSILIWNVIFIWQMQKKKATKMQSDDSAEVKYLVHSFQYIII